MEFHLSMDKCGIMWVFNNAIVTHAPSPSHQHKLIGGINHSHSHGWFCLFSWRFVLTFLSSQSHPMNHSGIELIAGGSSDPSHTDPKKVRYWIHRDFHISHYLTPLLSHYSSLIIPLINMPLLSHEYTIVIPLLVLLGYYPIKHAIFPLV